MDKMLIIDDEQSICKGFQSFFTKRGWTVDAAASIKDGKRAFDSGDYDVVFLDVRLPDGNGLDLLETFVEADPNAKVVVISAYGTLETVTQAVRGKAFDYVAKPIDLDQVDTVVERVLRERDAALDSETIANDSAMIGSSKLMQEVYKRIGLVAISESSVLIHGETGTGKELVARAIHAHGKRADGPFIAVNCGALPEHLVESELFGHEKGAFTGAHDTRQGRFETANGGILFLDEIGELPLGTQAKLLRVLDGHAVERLGGDTPIHADVRVLAASNKKLADEVREGRFRADLFYRLNVIHLELPPLRARREDVMPLARHFVATLKPGVTISTRAEEVLRAHFWPGNVRELRNAIEHAIVVSGGTIIQPDHLPEPVLTGESLSNKLSSDAIDAYLDSLPMDGGDLYARAVEPIERAVIQKALKATGNKKSEAADLLGVHRNTLRTKMEALGL